MQLGWVGGCFGENNLQNEFSKCIFQKTNETSREGKVIMRTVEFDGKKDLYLMDLLLEFLEGRGFNCVVKFNHIDDDDLFDYGEINRAAYFTKDEVDFMYNALVGRDIREFDITINGDISNFFDKVMIPLFKHRRFSYAIRGLNGGIALSGYLDESLREVMPHKLDVGDERYSCFAITGEMGGTGIPLA